MCVDFFAIKNIFYSLLSLSKLNHAASERIKIQQPYGHICVEVCVLGNISMLKII